MLDIKLEAEGMTEGENRYTTCPACGADRKFSILLDNGRVLYHCFRASCQLHGGGVETLSGAPRVDSSSRRARKRKVVPYDGEVMHLDKEWQEYLSRKIGFTDWHIDTGRVMYAPREHRVAYPILSPLGMRRGWSLRTYEKEVEPKSLTRMDVDEPHLSWYVTHPESRSVLVVEDIPSAIRAAKYVSSVALLGTGCNEDYAREIAAHARNVVWALDADATEQALRLQKKYALLFDSSRVLMLERDLKDLQEDQLCDMLQL